MPSGRRDPGVPGLAVATLAGAEWRDRGLRGFIAYRDLGVAAATGGAVRAEHIRVTRAAGAGTGWHVHRLTFQMVYVLAGWVRFTAHGAGEITLATGDCAILPPGLAHDEHGFSPDFEVIEVTMPAEVATERVAAPDPCTGPDRPIVVSRDSAAAYIRGDGPRAFLAYRDLGAMQPTGRRVQAQVVRTGRPCTASTGWHHHTLECQFVAVLDGWTTVEAEGAGRIRMQRGDAITIPGGHRHDVTGFSADFSVLEINVPGDFATVPG